MTARETESGTATGTETGTGRGTETGIGTGTIDTGMTAVGTTATTGGTTAGVLAPESVGTGTASLEHRLALPQPRKTRLRLRRLHP